MLNLFFSLLVTWKFKLSGEAEQNFIIFKPLIA